MSDFESANVVALLPAAGRATRIAPSPCSKEVYPIGFRRDASSGTARPKVASHHLFEKFRTAGAATAFVILRDGKWDIPAYFGDGSLVGIPIAYVVIDDSIGPPDSLDRAYRFVADKTVLFGFPDILFGPDDVLARVLSRLRHTESDIAMGLYVAHDSAAMDTIDVDDAGCVKAMALKAAAISFRYSWLCAAWTPAFTRFLHDFVGAERRKAAASDGDLPVGAAIKAAIESGLHACGVAFENETYLDIGTPDNLREAVRRAADLEVG